ncbi:MAG: hypothetical protein HQL01_08660 [Nitrospirae bacterium]|nr:hypothetical protein [Nitrospirota bacterium]
MMARDASTLGELFHNIRYQGHPSLWFLTLYVLSAITPNPVIMQIFHLALATAVAFIALKYAPFTRIQKVLFIFGYYPFYEYCVISRNYAYGLLFLLIFLSLFRPGIKDKKYINLSIVLFFLCQSNPYGATIAIALALMLLFEWIFFRDASVDSKTKWEFAAGILIFTCGLLLSAMQMHPPHDSTWYNPKFFEDNVMLVILKIFEAIAFIWSAYIPIPMFSMQFWGYNFLTHLIADPYKEVTARLYLSLGLAAITTMFFLRRCIALFYYVIGTLGVILFSYAIYVGAIRHRGHFFIVLFSAIWISNLYNVKSFKTGIFNKVCEFFENEKNAFFTFLLMLNVVAGVTANTMDYLYPFSANKETALYIKATGLDKMPVLGDKDYATSGVAAYLNRSIYYPATQRQATFVTWDNKRRGFNGSNILKEAELYSFKEKKDILLVISYPITPDSLAEYGNVEFIKSFTNSVLTVERFYLYKMKYVPH